VVLLARDLEVVAERRVVRRRRGRARDAAGDRDDDGGGASEGRGAPPRGHGWLRASEDRREEEIARLVRSVEEGMRIAECGAGAYLCAARPGQSTRRCRCFCLGLLYSTNLSRGRQSIVPPPARRPPRFF
jgi:hypothetical protein